MWMNVVLYLIIYSFVGWVCECIYCSVGNKKLINRGFLYGPFCPIYGFGALLVVYLLSWLPQSVAIIFVAGAIVTSALEYLTSFLMEKLFSTTWWDYSQMRFNLNGRICLLNSTLFGIMCVVVMFDVHPVVSSWIEPLHYYFKLGFLCAFAFYFAFDLTATLYSVLGINARLKKLDAMARQLAEKYGLDEYKDEWEDSLVSIHAKLKELSETGDWKDELMEQFEKLQEKSSFLERRMLSAFPQMEHRKYTVQGKRLHAQLKEYRDRRKARK